MYTNSKMSQLTSDMFTLNIARRTLRYISTITITSGFRWVGIYWENNVRLDL